MSKFDNIQRIADYLSKKRHYTVTWRNHGYHLQLIDKDIDIWPTTLKYRLGRDGEIRKASSVHDLCNAVHQCAREPDKRRTRCVAGGPFYDGEPPPWAFERWAWMTREQKLRYSDHINAELRAEREAERREQ